MLRWQIISTALFIGALGITSGVFANAQKDFIEVEIKKGDTLTVIARRYLDDPRKWRELLRYNNIPKPNLILPGLILKVPGFLGKQPLAEVMRVASVSEMAQSSAGPWETLARDQKLFDQDRLKTDATGSVSLNLPGSGRLLIRSNSYVVLLKENLAQKKSSRVLLRSGRMESFLKPQEKPRKGFEVDTPAAQVSVRGTKFVTVVDKDKNTSVSCEKGKVAVSAQGKTVEVPAGFAVFVKKGQPPGKPFTTLPPPKVEILVP